jgi:hypothetical protein
MAVGAVASPVSAEQVTLGVPTPQFVQGSFYDGGTVIETALPGGDNVIVPGTGRIVAWWAVGEGAEPGATLRVAHTTMSGQFTAEETSVEEPLSTTLKVFPTSLPVHTADLIGATVFDGDGESGVAAATDSQSAVRDFGDSFPDGSTEAGLLVQNVQLQLGARFVFAPVVSALSASHGSTSGGEQLVITGQHLTQSTEVRFGSKPAVKFTIDSNTRITATAPAASAGAVNITVAGPGGASATGSGDRYTFVAPTVKVSPSSLDFGSELVGRASRARVVTLSNTGSVAVSIGTTRLTGADAGDFTRSSDSCSQRRIAPGRSCWVRLVFVPGAKGSRLAKLVLADDAAGGPHRVVLTGTGKSAPPP